MSSNIEMEDDDPFEQMSSSPSINEEEIDFHYVYALRSFIATEQGQANAYKGDAMILLNDANSYWWLVRLVKDSSVGFLPAEHVETPWERLARLNKHRNGDLCSQATAQVSSASRGLGKMFKSRKKNNGKSVSFGAQATYVSASEYEFSEDEADDEHEEGEEEESEEELEPEPIQQQQQQQQHQEKQPGPVVVEQVEKKKEEKGFWGRKKKDHAPGQEPPTSKTTQQLEEQEKAKRRSLLKSKSSVEQIKRKDDDSRGEKTRSPPLQPHSQYSQNVQALHINGVNQVPSYSSITDSRYPAPTRSFSNQSQQSQQSQHSFNSPNSFNSSIQSESGFQPHPHLQPRQPPPSRYNQQRQSPAKRQSVPIDFHPNDSPPSKSPPIEEWTRESMWNTKRRSDIQVNGESEYMPYVGLNDAQSKTVLESVAPLQYKNNRLSMPQQPPAQPRSQSPQQPQQQQPQQQQGAQEKPRGGGRVSSGYNTAQPPRYSNSPQYRHGSSGVKNEPPQALKPPAPKQIQEEPKITKDEAPYVSSSILPLKLETDMTDFRIDFGEKRVQGPREYVELDETDDSDVIITGEKHLNPKPTQPPSSSSSNTNQSANWVTERPDLRKVIDHDSVRSHSSNSTLLNSERSHSSNSNSSPPCLDREQESPISSEQEDTPYLLASIPEDHLKRWNGSNTLLNVGRINNLTMPLRTNTQQLETKTLHHQPTPITNEDDSPAQKPLHDLHPDIVPIFKDTSDRLGVLSSKLDALLQNYK